MCEVRVMCVSTDHNTLAGNWFGVSNFSVSVVVEYACQHCVVVGVARFKV